MSGAISSFNGGFAKETGINARSPPLLGDSIWLYCGADGVKIWLPLDTVAAKRSSVGDPPQLPPFPPSPGVERKGQLAASVGAYVPPPVQSTKASRRVMISLGLDGVSYPLGEF